MSTLKTETGAKNIMPNPLAGGQEISFAPQMTFLGLRPGGCANKSVQTFVCAVKLIGTVCALPITVALLIPC